ncbi:MAG: hypothetical protein ACI9OJ_003492, partial [Myxococcota bacterium]
TDLASDVGAYTSELVTATVQIGGGWGFAGTGFTSADVSTDGVDIDGDVALRVPDALLVALPMDEGCIVVVGPTPLWRHNGSAQISAFTIDELTVTSCSAPQVVSASATSPTTVFVVFTNPIDASTVNASGDQFTFTGGVVASAAAVDGNIVEVTTSQQPAAQDLVVTVATSVTDVYGTALDETAVDAGFLGFTQAAALIINEINGNISGGCDLVELYAVAGGSVDGMVLKARNDVLADFAGLVVETGDVIVVHANMGSDTCSTGSGNETASKNEQDNATFSHNYDSAWDWYGAKKITATDNVIALFNSTGDVLDAVLVSDDETGTAAASSETAAAIVAAAGQWFTTGGIVPAGGFVDGDFNANAVQGLGDTSTDTGGDTIQRSSATDTNDLNGWGVAGETWGAANAAP